jgi:uncharacterized protein
MLSEGEIRALLKAVRTIAIVGLSANPARDSHAVAGYLQRNGYRIVPVNPMLSEPVLDERPYPSLRDIPFAVDVAQLFRRPEFVPAAVDDAITAGVGVVWMQLGIAHVEAARQAEEAGLSVVMDRCMAIEHRRLIR